MEVVWKKKERDHKNGFNGSRRNQPRTMPTDGRMIDGLKLNSQGLPDGNLGIIDRRLENEGLSTKDQ